MEKRKGYHAVMRCLLEEVSTLIRFSDATKRFGSWTTIQ